MLNKLKFSDSLFWSRYTINPYRGCSHACIYCDGRSERYYTQVDFDEKVIPKTDMPESLLRYIKNSRSLLRDVVGPGGVCDCYQPIEKDLLITRQILKILSDNDFALSISTKSNLILRDCDLLKEISEKTWCSVAVSISSVDESWSSILEPNAATPKDRFMTLRKIKEECPKVHTGINFMPIIPYICDTEENLEKVIRMASEAKADYVLFMMGVTLRDRQGEFFYDKLKDRPQTVEKIKQIQNYSNQEWIARVAPKHQRILDLMQQYNLKIRPPRYIPSDFRKTNYKIAEILFNDSFLKRLQFKNTYNEEFVANYINVLPEPIEALINTNRLDTIPKMTSKIKDQILSLVPKNSGKMGLNRFL